MTAEIIIMNKTAIALAADSAVTIGDEGKKIYNTVNKLFTLSKHHPVGIMIYDNAEIMGVPWETVIKLFRKHLGTTEYKSLADYYDEFTKFIENANIMFTDEQQEQYFYNILSVHFLMVLQAIDSKIKKDTECNGNLKLSEIKKIVSDKITSCLEHFERQERLPDYTDEYIEKTLDKYKDIINTAKEDVFQKLPISKTNAAELTKLAAEILVKKCFSIGKTGIVIAGFGTNDIFPSLIECAVESVINNKLKKYSVIEHKIGFNNLAEIVPFAQQEMPYRFMEGIDPVYDSLITKSFSEFISHYAEVVVNDIKKLTPMEKKAILQKLSTNTKPIMDEYFKMLKKHRQDKYVNPVIRAVASLPTDELAAMAESLVHLTSLKRKFSLEKETVAGPIDVAIISKGDGFVWIKRKHYFKSEFNPAFFHNYFN